MQLVIGKFFEYCGIHWFMYELTQKLSDHDLRKINHYRFKSQFGLFNELKYVDIIGVTFKEDNNIDILTTINNEYFKYECKYITELLEEPYSVWMLDSNDTSVSKCSIFELKNYLKELFETKEKEDNNGKKTNNKKRRT